jgi:hypothetical protein
VAAFSADLRASDTADMVCDRLKGLSWRVIVILFFSETSGATGCVINPVVSNFRLSNGSEWLGIAISTIDDFASIGAETSLFEKVGTDLFAARLRWR